MSLTYTTWVDQFANLLVYTSTEASFQTMVQSAIDYSEGRMYRELDLLATRVTDATASLSSGNRNFTLPTTNGEFLVVESINAITPATAASTTGSRVPLTPVAREWIDMVYPSNTNATGVPAYFSRINNTAIIVGPSPSAAYTLEVVGTQQPTALSSANPTTILTTMLPDLWLAATMIFGTAFQRDFGSQADDPKSAQSWESQYKTLMQSADVTELRKKYMSQGWTSLIPNQIATPPRA